MYRDIVNKHIEALDHAENLEHVLAVFDNVLFRVPSLPVIEIGTNLGGSALCFLDVLKKYGGGRPFFTVDPYGAIPYHNGHELTETSVYDNNRYRLAMKRLADHCFENNLDHCHFKVDSDAFLDHFLPHLSYYEDSKVTKVEQIVM